MSNGRFVSPKIDNLCTTKRKHLKLQQDKGVLVHDESTRVHKVFHSGGECGRVHDVYSESVTSLWYQ